MPFIYSPLRRAHRAFLNAHADMGASGAIEMLTLEESSGLGWIPIYSSSGGGPRDLEVMKSSYYFDLKVFGSLVDQLFYIDRV